MTAPPLNPGLFHMDPFHLYVMHCVEGPATRAVVKGVHAWLHREVLPWDMRWKEDVLGIPARARSAAASVLGCEVEDISLCSNTSAGLATVAHGLNWRPGDEIMAPMGEFPSNIYIWKSLEARGVSFRELPLWEGQRSGRQAWDSTPPPMDVDFTDRIIRNLGLRTRLLALSWVRFQDGIRFDLKRLGQACKERNIYLVVDGIQGAGILQPDLTHVSAFSTGGNKGLLGVQGQGVLWTSPDFRKQLLPSGTWFSTEDCDNPKRDLTDPNRPFFEDGRRLEGGMPNLMSCAAFAESLELLKSAQISAIQTHVQSLQQNLLLAMHDLTEWKPEIARLKNLSDSNQLGPILSFHHHHLDFEAIKTMLDRGLVRGIYASEREGYLRIALHGWHEEEDINRLAEWMAMAPKLVMS